MMRKCLTSSFSSILVGLCLISPVATQASEAFQLASVGQFSQQEQEDIPLVVIRFNQKRMYFDRQLYQAVSKAVSVKPTVIFDIVSFVPVTKNQKTNQIHVQKATSQASTVINSLLKMGVPRTHIRISKDKAPDLRHHEIHIYVE